MTHENGARNPNWPAGLLASAYGPSRHEQGLTMAICVGYFGASPSAERVFTVEGYVSSKARWRLLDERWPRALRSEGLWAFNGQEFIHSKGVFSTGWSDDGARRRRLMTVLAKLTQQHVLGGFSCSVRLDDYEVINRKYRFAETAGGPYGLCAAGVTALVQPWMAAHFPAHLTLSVFEDGDVSHREIRRILGAEGLTRGEPAQVWPRRWMDECGRQRLLVPFEACDLLHPSCGSGLAELLSQGAAWQREVIDLDRLRRISTALALEPRSKAG